MEIDPRSALRLFQAVVTQAVIDATLPVTFDKRPLTRRKDETDAEHEARTAEAHARRESAAQRDRDEARDWLLVDMESFPFVTSLAGYNPTDVRERARKLARQGWPKRRLPREMAEAA